ALNDSEARLSAKAVIQADRETVANVRVTLTAPDGSQQQVVQQVTLAAGTNAVTLPITVAHPQRWQPVGYGTQPLYRVSATLNQNGEATD
ncbi:hypothetical protein, partial [Escherichia coli]|uniref:hypothetical protein n=1 Tax=Escherichia coli TaxID=562 RepID=UPI003D35C549